ncbi:hypothetical protein [Micromonospora sp. NPDC050200]|uniref:hypothetical protein n=1 Tax=Micromonospora sp. NPDC050200 TaxID=3155664 RepID=UPI0033E92E27
MGPKRVPDTAATGPPDGRLMVTYTTYDGPGLPVATVSVEPPPQEPEQETLEDLPDVGEDLPLAQWRAWLSEAAHCLADARTRPEPRFFHPQGQAIYKGSRGLSTRSDSPPVENAWRGEDPRVRRRGHREHPARGAGSEGAAGGETLHQLRAMKQGVRLTTQMVRLFADGRGVAERSAPGCWHRIQ